MKLRYLFIMIGVSLALVGCSGRVDISRNDSGGVDLRVTLSEADVNTLVTNAINQQAEPVLQNPNVDLQSGRIVISGDRQRPDGSGLASGSVTLTAAMNGSQIDVQILEANIEGFDATDERLQELNQRIEDALNARADNDNARARITAISIDDNNLALTISTSSE